MNSISGSVFNHRIYSGGGYSLHFHKSFELIYVKEGNISCTVGRRHYELKKNDFLIILPYEIHSFSVTDGSRVSIAVFSENYVKSFSKLIRGKVCECPVFSCGESVRLFYETELYDKFGEFFMEDPTDDMMLTAKACLYAVCSECYKSVEFSDSSRSGAELPEKVLAYISEHYASPISLDDLASACCMNRSYFCRRFREITGRTAISYVNEYRLTKARALLLTGERSISEVAAECGFSDGNYFSRLFMRHFGETPHNLKKKGSLQ